MAQLCDDVGRYRLTSTHPEEVGFPFISQQAVFFLLNVIHIQQNIWLTGKQYHPHASDGLLERKSFFLVAEYQLLMSKFGSKMIGLKIAWRWSDLMICLIMNFSWESASFCLLRITWALSIIYFVEKNNNIALVVFSYILLSDYISGSSWNFVWLKAFVAVECSQAALFCVSCVVCVCVSIELSRKNWFGLWVILGGTSTFQIA